MTDEDDPSGRDIRIMWRTVTVVAVCVAAVASSIIYAVVWAVQHDSRIAAVEHWQEAKDKQAAEDARRDAWRRERERLLPGIRP
jgi:hypothetical protein